MSSNVLTLEKQTTTDQKVESFIMRNRKVLISILLFLIVAVIGICVYALIAQSQKNKGLSAVDAIEFTFERDIAKADDAELLQKQNTALEELKPYLSEKNIIGLRANMLAAEIYWQKKDYASSLSSYLNAASIQEKSYTAPLCYYNAASCSEELNNNEDAAKYYEKAASSKDFILRSHALFNQARVKESLGNINEAQELYQQLIDDYPYDSWANLAQSRLIALKAEGKIQ